MILLFLAGAATELLIFAWTRLTAERKLRRVPLLAVTAAEYALWALVVRKIVLEGSWAVLAYALGGLSGVFLATLLPVARGLDKHGS